MAKPVLALAKVTPDGRSFHLTNLTSRHGTFDDTDGYSKADWYFWLYDGQELFKKQNYQTLKPTAFVASGSMPSANSGYGNPTVLWGSQDEADNYGSDNYDSINNTVSSTQGGSYLFGSAQTNCGVRFTFPATKDKQTLFFAGTIYEPTWQASATISDGSATATPITLDSNGSSWFTLTFRSMPPGATVTLEVKRTATNGNASTCSPRVVYATIPIPRLKPRNYSNTLRRLRALGASV